MPEELAAIPAGIEKAIDETVSSIILTHSISLTSGIMAYYKAGSNGVRVSKFGKLQQAAISKLTAQHFGKLAEFDRTIGEQIKEKARDIIRSGGGYDAIKTELLPYIDDVFSGKEHIVINNVGKIRTEIRLSKDGQLFKIEKVVENPFRTTPESYATSLARTATHKAFEQGRADEYQRMGIKFWRFTGPADERARPWHVAILGNVYEYGTEQSDLALELLGEHNCRHRAVAYFGNGMDVPQKFYDAIKAKAGVAWNEDVGDWAIAA